GEESLRKARTSSGVGGRPVKSRYKRRISVRRSAGVTGLRWFISSVATMKASIGLRTQRVALTDGTAGRLTDKKAQCFSSLPFPFWASGAPARPGARRARTRRDGVLQGIRHAFIRRSSCIQPVGKVPFGDPDWRGRRG